MNKSKFAVRGYTIAGCLWIFAGLLSLLNHRSWGDNIWRIIFGVGMGIFFLSLARQQARKARGQ
jgi:hypothetical protein